MSTTKQKDAVFTTITNLLALHRIEFTQHSTIVKAIITKEMKAEIVATIAVGLQCGEIEMKRRPDTDAKLKAYAIGLVDNWLRKDSRLNGTPAKAPKVKKEKAVAVVKKAKPAAEVEIPFGDNPATVSLEAEDQWEESFNSILSCHELYTLDGSFDTLLVAVKDLKELFPNVTDKMIRAYLSVKYPDQTQPDSFETVQEQVLAPADEEKTQAEVIRDLSERRQRKTRKRK